MQPPVTAPRSCVRRADLLCTGQLACLSPYAGARAARPPPARARAAPTRVVPRGEVPRSDTAMRARVTGRMLLQFINMGKSNTRIMTMRQRPRMHSRYETSVLTRRGAAIPVSLNLERLRYGNISTTSRKQCLQTRTIQ